MSELNDREFLLWLYARLTKVYGESPNTDFCQRLLKIASEQPVEDDTDISCNDCSKICDDKHIDVTDVCK